MSKPFKVWNYDRSVRKAVSALSLAELLEKGRYFVAVRNLWLNQHLVVKLLTLYFCVCVQGQKKLGCVGDVTVVLEEDGTEVDEDDYFQSIERNTVFLFLLPGEGWSPAVKGK